MKNLFDDNDLEQFLTEETKQHRMYPSDKIWRNIQNELHGKKRWPALTIITLFIISALTVSTLINNHPVPIAEKQIVQPETSIVIAEKKKTVAYKEQLFANNITTKTFASIKEKNKQEELEAYEALVKSTNTQVASVINTDKSEVVFYQPHIVESSTEKVPKNSTNSVNDTYTSVEQQIKQRLNKPQTEVVVADNILPTNAKQTNVVKGNQIVTASLIKEVKKSVFKQPVDDNPAINEDALASGQFLSKLKNKPSKFDVQFYITPSVSYRKLVDDKERTNYERPSLTTIPGDLGSSVDLDDVVRHKPAMGVEFGVGVIYKLTNRLKIKTGLQLNSRQYYIAGYQSTNGSGKLAAITLVSGNRLDTFYQYSNFSSNTSNGAKQSQLDNKLYQISMPIGLQWDFIQGKHLGLSVGASVQPTLTLNKNIYLISTDYKYYTDGTPFFRRWNINSSAELNITYNVGAYQWYIGPQIRYQHLPTYTESYPIKEYRLDYGFKIGFTKPL